MTKTVHHVTNEEIEFRYFGPRRTLCGRSSAYWTVYGSAVSCRPCQRALGIGQEERLPISSFYAAAGERLITLAAESGATSLKQIERFLARLLAPWTSHYAQPYSMPSREAAVWTRACLGLMADLRAGCLTLSSRPFHGMTIEDISSAEVSSRITLRDREISLRRYSRTRESRAVLRDFYLETGRGPAWFYELRPGDPVIVVNMSSASMRMRRVDEVDAKTFKVRIDKTSVYSTGADVRNGLQLLPIAKHLPPELRARTSRAA